MQFGHGLVVRWCVTYTWLFDYPDPGEVNPETRSGYIMWRVREEFHPSQREVGGGGGGGGVFKQYTE